MPELIQWLAFVKKAAAMANMELGVLQAVTVKAITQACDEIIAGKFHHQFVVDVIQGGAGTSTNMNVNEVVANRALEILGYEKGRYDVVHPLNHVNCSQSTNDVYPTAVRLALLMQLNKMTDDMTFLQASFDSKAVEFSDVIKMGRTQLQDAVPMTLGQEFSAYATTIGEDVVRVREVRELLLEINLPPVQPGSSIMPGKVNPVTPEVVNQVAYEVIGNDVTVSFAAEAGQLELNAMESVIAHNLFRSIDMLRRACRVLAGKCVDGIAANRERCRKMVENSIGIVTALNPIIGYENSAAVAREALETDRPVYDLVLEKGLLTREALDEILAPENMMRPRILRKRI